MNIIFKSLTAGILAVSLSACDDGVSGGNYNNQAILGGITGAVAGGALGSTIGKGRGRTAAITIGALLGGAAGYEIGRSLSSQDRASLSDTTYQSLAYDQDYSPRSWNSSDSDYYGSVTPTRTYEDRYGQTCRQFEQTIYIEGRRETGRGTACRNQDGSWQIVS